MASRLPQVQRGVGSLDDLVEDLELLAAPLRSSVLAPSSASRRASDSAMRLNERPRSPTSSVPSAGMRSPKCPSASWAVAACSRRTRRLAPRATRTTASTRTIAPAVP